MEAHAERLVFAATHVPGFTKACATHGDAPTFSALAAYYALVGRAASGAGGRVVKVMGDGTLLCFPEGRVREVVDALRVLQDEASKLWRDFDERCHVQVKVGIGTVRCGQLGAPGEERFDIVGDSVNRMFKAPWSDFDVTPELAEVLAATGKSP